MKHDKHEVRVEWTRRPGEAFKDVKYSREHLWKFDGGATVAASSSPHVVPLPYSKAENIDPEEALVAAISSCHLLVFLHRAALSGYVVDSYEDTAVGEMGEFEAGKPAVVRAALHPFVTFSGARRPDAGELDRLHHEAHDMCFIANSIRTKVTVEGHFDFHD